MGDYRFVNEEWRKKLRHSKMPVDNNITDIANEFIRKHEDINYNSFCLTSDTGFIVFLLKIRCIKALRDRDQLTVLDCVLMFIYVDSYYAERLSTVTSRKYANKRQPMWLLDELWVHKTMRYAYHYGKYSTSEWLDSVVQNLEVVGVRLFGSTEFAFNKE